MILYIPILLVYFVREIVSYVFCFFIVYDPCLFHCSYSFDRRLVILSADFNVLTLFILWSPQPFGHVFACFILQIILLLLFFNFSSLSLDASWIV